MGDQPSAFLYGTNAFPTQGGLKLDLSHYAYAGEVCDCATSSAVASGEACQDGWVFDLLYDILVAASWKHAKDNDIALKSNSY